ncbi:MAG: transporter substrate-binding domain-containing protein [Clostridia bacterium]|nr:transporter substrate-binding domain-containing protein [Clostridia bacterium]
MEERADDMLFSVLPMGTEAYYVFVAPDNTDITSESYATLAGKRVGVAKASVQSDMLLKWTQTHGINAKIVELTTPEEESLRLLGSELDAFVTMDVQANPETAIPVWKIGSSDFYFAVSKSRPDLLAELNTALSRIQDENKYYAQQLNDKYLKSAETSMYLSREESAWLLNHGTIRVGYQDGYLVFCAKDESTGELTGALKDYLDYASACFENAHLNFEAVCFPSAGAAMEALSRGEIDCMFPANLTAYDSETLDVVMTPALMTTEMDAVVRASEQKEFIRKEKVIVAVNEGNTNYERFLLDHFPGWQVKYYADMPTGLEGIAAGEADCVIISNYRFSNIAKQCEKLRLATVYTGVDMDYYFAVRRGDTELYSILSKTTSIVPDSIVHTALTFYSTEDAKTSFVDVIKDNLTIVMSVIAGTLFVILVLLLFSIRTQKKAIQEHHLVEDLNKQVFVDALTHVRNKGGYDDYIRQLQLRLDKGEPLEMAIGVFDCDNLKAINDQHGHDKGNIYLTTACRLICKTFQHSPVFRMGGDEFTVILQNGDLKNREELVKAFEEKREEICASAENKWEEIHIALGIAVYDPEIDQSVNDTARRADKMMYENKRKAKNGRR